MASKIKATSKAEPAPSGCVSRGEGHRSHSQNTINKDDATSTAKSTSELMQLITDLNPRVRELESVLTGSTWQSEAGRVDHHDTSSDAANIIEKIRDLQHQNDAVHVLKTSIEAELAETKRSLAEERSARAELEARVEALKAKAGRAVRLEEEAASLERQQNQTAHRLREATSELKLISEERNHLAEQKADDKRHIGELERSITELKSQLSRLGETATVLSRLRGELSDATKALAASREESQQLKETAQTLKNKLEATKVAQNTLDLELSTSRQLIGGLNQHIEELTGALEAARADLNTAQAVMAKQEAENKTLVQANARSEHEIKTLKVRITSLEEEVDLSTQALREIRTATIRTTGRILETGD